MKRIREMMKQNKNKREVNMHKQQLKIIDIHEKLLDEGFKIGYTTVRNFVNREEKKEKEVFIRQEPTAGREIEFDWGEVKLFIDGKLRSLSMAVFTLAYSNDRYARIYESETMVCVQDAHVKCIEACLAGYKVYFTSVASLGNQLRKSRSARTLRSFELKFEKYDVVIIDELSYISFDKEGAELLFTHLSLRAVRAATIITSNLTFERWEEVFHDPVLTSALTDRLTHRAHIINMIGGSYRILETKEWMEQSNF